jgi:hypothetical protein
LPDGESGRSEVVPYEAPGGEVQLEVKLDRDTVWLTQAQMADLFGRERSVVTKHVRNVFADGELAEESNVQKLHIANSDKPVAFYNLDVVIRSGTATSALVRSYSCFTCSRNKSDTI